MLVVQGGRILHELHEIFTTSMLTCNGLGIKQVALPPKGCGRFFARCNRCQQRRALPLNRTIPISEQRRPASPELDLGPTCPITDILGRSSSESDQVIEGNGMSGCEVIAAAIVTPEKRSAWTSCRAKLGEEMPFAETSQTRASSQLYMYFERRTTYALFTKWMDLLPQSSHFRIACTVYTPYLRLSILYGHNALPLAHNNLVPFQRCLDGVLGLEYLVKLFYGSSLCLREREID